MAQPKHTMELAADKGPATKAIPVRLKKRAGPFGPGRGGRRHLLPRGGLLSAVVVVCSSVALLAPAASAQVLGPPDLATMQTLQGAPYNWGTAFGWPVGTNPCPEFGAFWNGVTCDTSHGHVIYITVGCGTTPLTTPFPGPVLATLSQLENLKLNNCYLQSQPASNLSSLGDLANLQTLDLVGDPGFTGTLAEAFPGGIGPTALPELVQLMLSGSGFTGPLPAGVFEWGSTAIRWLNDNHFSGELPSTCGGGPCIAPGSLRLQGNELSGTLPSWLVNVPSPGQHNILIDYNMFDVTGTPAGNIDSLDPTWRDTQTVPPTNVQVTGTGAGSATLSWTPIAYQANGGYYEVLSSETKGGPYSLAGTTAASGGKAATGLTVTNLPGGTNYFVVETYTPANPDNSNNLTSIASSEVSRAGPRCPQGHLRAEQRGGDGGRQHQLLRCGERCPRPERPVAGLDRRWDNMGKRPWGQLGHPRPLWGQRLPVGQRVRGGVHQLRGVGHK